MASSGFWRRAGIFTALLILIALTMRAPGRLDPIEATEGSSKAFSSWVGEGSEDGEAESIEARVLDYLERHGDRGHIDPERRLARIREEYRRHRERQAALRSAGAVAVDTWVSLGPTNGAGRMTSVAPSPDDANTVYAGAAGGGVWKTTDRGVTWRPLTEGLLDLSVGALAIPPTSPSTVYVGTGEGGASSSFIPGIGFLKSTDGGENWILPPSVLASQFYRILVHPTNANELVAGTNEGAFRSTDGGASWTNVLSRATYGHVPDMVRHPSNPQVLYATTWCVDTACANRSARVLRSEDGGVTWSDRSTGLPTGQVGRYERTSIAIAQTSPEILYAARGLFDLAGTGEMKSHIYKTTNEGLSWADLPAVSGDPDNSQYMVSQSWYDNVLIVAPHDANLLVAGGVGYLRTTNGGASFDFAFNNFEMHVDAHDFRYRGSTLWIANDGGIYSSENHGVTQTEHNTGLVTRQFYAMSNDPTNSARMIAGSQDNGSSQRLEPGTAWREISGADGIQCAIHPLSPELAWVSFQGGVVRRTRAVGASGPNGRPVYEDVTPPFDPEEVVPFRTIVRPDPRRPGRLYSASSRLWRSDDGGDTWRPMPTTTADGSPWSLTTTIRAVALPASESDLVIVAKGNGVFRSDDGGMSWTAGSGLPDLVVTNVEIDPHDASTVYATIATTSGSSLYRSGDGGRTWIASAAGLPPFAAQVVRVHPVDANIVYCGTDVGLFQSIDGGTTWSRLGSGLPASSIHDMRIFEDGSLLRVATYGRGVWELVVGSEGNTPPEARVTIPSGPLSVTAGTIVELTGEVSDPDGGDAVTGTWFFPDDGTSQSLPSGGGTVRHTFRTSGVFPVALAARDARGSRRSAIVTVSVREAADDCGTPLVVPSAGPFPYALSWSDEAGGLQGSDPQTPCFGGGGRNGSTWFEFTPATSGTYEFSTCTSVSTAVTLVTGSACGPYTAVPFVCQPTGGVPGCGFGSMSITASLQAGVTVRAMLGGVAAHNLGRVRLTVAPVGVGSAAPRVDRVGPAFGSTGGGTTVVIQGDGFSAPPDVTFGGVRATEVTVLSGRVLSAKTPQNAAGPVAVTVTMPGGATSTLANAFRYEPLESAARVPPQQPIPHPRPIRTVAPR